MPTAERKRIEEENPRIASEKREAPENAPHRHGCTPPAGGGQCPLWFKKNERA